jgi:hypothetical protein
MNKAASIVWACTPRDPVTAEQADDIREMVEDLLHDLAEQVDQKIQGFGESEAPKEEEVIIITSPPP